MARAVAVAVGSPARDRGRSRPIDLAAIVVGNGLLIAAMWVRHGGLGELGLARRDPHGRRPADRPVRDVPRAHPAGPDVAQPVARPGVRDGPAGGGPPLGRLRLRLAARRPRRPDHGRLRARRRARRRSARRGPCVTTYPFVLWAVVGLGLFIAVAVSSMRAARRRLSYETWYGIHLYAYLAVALTFAHQLVVGADFADDPVARLYWIGLYVATAATILVFRFGQPIRVSLRHRLRVANVVREGPGVVSIYLTGRDLDRLAIRSGQYLVCRFLTRDGWWRGHPFSISAAPNGEWLRITVKDLGDDTARLQRLTVGTPRLRRGSVRGADRRPADPLARPAGRRRDRDHAAPGAARGAAGPAGRDDPRLPGQPARRTSSSAPSSTRSPALNGATVHYLVGPARQLGDADRAARTRRRSRARPGRRRARRLPVRPRPR